MRKHKIRYRVIELEIDDECETCWNPSIEPEWAVEECAKHFDHPDYTDDWPLTFALLNDDGSESGRYTVEVEFEPTFSAVKIDEEPSK